MDRQFVEYNDLGVIAYKPAWDFQESLLQQNVQRKMALASQSQLQENAGTGELPGPSNRHRADERRTKHYFLLCEHPPVYTLGKSGQEKNILISQLEMQRRGIEFFRINRGGDITFHGPAQLVGYPILDLERFRTDIGWYLRSLEETIILTLAEFGIKGERSTGETGVWIDPGLPGRERKICAMGVRCSRWITMHGFALNVNTDLSYFDNIVPCGIQNKQVTSIKKELGHAVNLSSVKESICRNFEKVFDATLRLDRSAINAPLQGSNAAG